MAWQTLLPIEKGKVQMKILKYRIYIDLLIGLYGILIGLWLTAKIIVGIVRFYENLGIIWGSIFAIAGIILVSPFIGLIYLCLSVLKPHAKMLNLSISMDDNGGLLITNPPSEYKIHKPNMKYILKGNLTTTIVWSPPDCPDSVKTFFVRKQYFPTKENKKFVGQLSAYECFSEDIEKNEKISTENGLRHIFRKNKLELEF